MSFIRLKALIAEALSKGQKYDKPELNQMSHANFRKVEFGCRHMPNFRNKIIDISEVKPLAEKYGNKEAYTSMFFYPESIADYVNSNLRNGKPSIAGYNGSVFSNYLFIDIDSKDNLKAKSSAEKLVSFCYDNLGCPEHALTISFSGNKGYHIGIDNRVFGNVNPSTNLNHVYAQLRKEIHKKARIESNTIDHSIKDRTRLWRLINSQNSKSGRFKIQVLPDDFFRMNDYSIREMAVEPQTVAITDETGLVPKYEVKPIDRAVEFYDNAVSKMGKRTLFSVPILKSTAHVKRAVKDSLCEAQLNLLKSGIPEGNRNNNALILSSAFRDSGMSEEAARNLIHKWNQVNEIGLSEHELRNVVRSAYSGSGYHYGCNTLVGFCPYKNWEECKDYLEFKDKIQV